VKIRSNYEKGVIAFFVCFFFISELPSFSDEQPTILLGLKWGDSEEIVHAKMQKLDLTCARSIKQEKRPGKLPLDITKTYKGKILEVDGYLLTGFQNNKLVKVTVSYWGDEIPLTLFTDLAKSLKEKYGIPNGPIANDYMEWQLKKIDTEIILEGGNDFPSLHYECLSWIDAHLKTKREEQQRRIEKLKKQL
jgi:hypothetical protein